MEVFRTFDGFKSKIFKVFGNINKEKLTKRKF